MIKQSVSSDISKNAPSVCYKQKLHLLSDQFGPNNPKRVKNFNFLKTNRGGDDEKT